MASEWKVEKSFATIGRLIKHLEEYKKEGWDWQKLKIAKEENPERYYLTGIIKDY